MGIYSKEAKQAYIESGLLLNRAPEDYYKAKMFYGNVQVYIDASNETEAKYFAARAINDFDTFCKCYAPDKDEKLNGIVVKPVGETNIFTACLSTDDKKIIETITVKEGKVIDTAKKVIDKTKEKVGAAINKVKDKVSPNEEKPEENEIVEEAPDSLQNIKNTTVSKNDEEGKKFDPGKFEPKKFEPGKFKVYEAARDF